MLAEHSGTNISTSISRNDVFPNRNTLRWVEALRDPQENYKDKGTRSCKNCEDAGKHRQGEGRINEDLGLFNVVLTRAICTRATYEPDSVRKILRLGLKFHSYKMQVVKQLKVRNYEQRVIFAVRMHAVFNDTP